jgi:hypothetical protein
LGQERSLSVVSRLPIDSFPESFLHFHIMALKRWIYPLSFMALLLAVVVVMMGEDDSQVGQFDPYTFA